MIVVDVSCRHLLTCVAHTIVLGEKLTVLFFGQIVPGKTPHEEVVGAPSCNELLISEGI